MGSYNFNEHNVCLNPDVVVQSKQFTITVAQAGKYWVTGYDIKLDSAGCGSPCSITIYNKITDKDKAIQNAINRCVSYVEHYLNSQKSAAKVLEQLKKLSKSEIIHPGDIIEKGQLSLF